MTRYASGEPELHRLSSGITEQNEGETKNLGELVAEARKRNNYIRTYRARKKDEHGYVYIVCQNTIESILNKVGLGDTILKVKEKFITLCLKIYWK